MKYIIGFILMFVFLLGCSPELSAGNLDIVGTISPSPDQVDFQADTLNSNITSEDVTPAMETSSFVMISREPSFPIRAVFYYPWFPQAWEQNGEYPFTYYRPSSGYYSQDDIQVIQQHIAAMQYGKIQAGISSWWGQGGYTDNRFSILLHAAEELGFFWSIYYEKEGYSNPTADEIRKDLVYIRDNYSDSPAYLKIDGRMVIFVYADKDDGCSMAGRWGEANTINAYLVLKVFSGYRDCTAQPDSWHQYSPDKDQKLVGKNSFVISPGYWYANEDQPRLTRDFDRWNADIQAMVASQTKFHLITTFNEWGEGTSIESAKEWESESGYGLYLDALHFDGQLPAGFFPNITPTMSPISTPLSTQQLSSVQGKGITLIGAGDIGKCGDNGVFLTANILENFPQASIFTTGDNTYPDGELSEFETCFDLTWGKYKDRIFPSAGNHDYITSKATGYYTYFGAAAGNPDQGYYSYDLGDWHIVVLNSNCSEIGGCNLDSPQMEWLKDDLAENSSLCTLAYWHHPLFSSGYHGNDDELKDFWQILYEAGADVVLNGHDHNYERFAPQDPFGNADYANGIREFVVGTGGGKLRSVSDNHEANSEIVIAGIYGVLKIELLADGFLWEFISTENESVLDSGYGVCHY